MSKVFIGVGHGGSDPGACANGMRESDVNLVMALAMKAELERHGITVGISRTKDENDRLAEEIRECNAFAPDLAVEVHNNAGGGDGFECLISGKNQVARQLAEKIEAEVKKIGQNSRGIKVSTTLGWVNKVKAPAVLCEGFFLDSSDRKIADTEAKQRAFGEAYARAVLHQLGAATFEKASGKTAPSDNGKPSLPYMVRVEITNLNIRKGPGTNYPSAGSTGKGSFTIVDEAQGPGSTSGWGKLKSGLGWISLDYIQRI